MNMVYKNALIKGKITDITVEKGKIVSLNKTQKEGIDLNGKNVTIVGRSNIVGKPLANLMINAGATVTVCNS